MLTGRMLPRGFRYLPLVLSLLIAPVLRAQDAPSPHPSPQHPGKRFWESSAAAMSEMLQRLNNYTCIQHVSRHAQARRDPLLRRMDTVRLQVTSIGSEEFYALPGGKESVRNPRDLIPTGMVGTGFFQGYAHTLFVRRGIQKLEFLGADGQAPHRLLRYRFVMDPVNEQLTIRLGAREALAPARGEFWLDEKDLLVRRIAVENVQPVRAMGVRRVLYIMDWAPVSTPGGRLLLPQSAEMWMVFNTGEVHRNDITLAQCREYRAESSIRFDMEDDAAAPTETDDGDEALVEGFLPSGVTLEIALSEEIPLRSAAVGDTFRAVLAKSAVRRGRELLPAGTAIQGRIRRIDRYSEPTPHAVAWLEFATLRHGTTEYTFLADMTDRDPLPHLVDRVPGMKQQTAARAREFTNYQSLSFTEPGYRSVPGVGSFVFSGDLPAIPAGYRMQWKTIPPRP